MGQCCGMERRITMLEVAADPAAKKYNAPNPSDADKPHVNVETVRGSQTSLEEPSTQAADLAALQKAVNSEEAKKHTQSQGSVAA